ncbi:hypothetical protein DQ384_05085 [Sphaerisporangium album]|uniref:Uncharacterized protein n=1 Tax=Sphaerisporangium album TaxID=509200 RepID=A0A367FQF7_9ACTN|nr:hypothetical protein [Sphaerisporangium album]RCG31920.1 hypothetical protein DQ384_05085 [Sphaerisporangium album]
MTWVRRATPQSHRCKAPNDGHRGNPTGQSGDLWRCDECHALWRIGHACDACDRYSTPHPGAHAVGLAWRPARWWQRLRYHRTGYPQLRKDNTAP